MERKAFLTTAAGVAASLTVAGAALGATPAPSRHSDRNIHRVRRRVERLIDELQRDQHDYCGHRVAAINHLQEARTELLAAERCDQQAGH